MNFEMDWVVWGDRLLWTAVTVGVAWLAGHVVNLFGLRLVTLATRTTGPWDDIVVAELRRRVPYWSLLVGVWYALRHWDLAADTQLLALQALTVLAGLSISWTAATIVSRLVRAYSSEVSTAVPVTGLTQNVARIVVMMLGGLIVLNEVGVSVTPLLTVLGVGGLAVGLALQDPLSNLFSGLVISLSGQIRVGDFIELEDGRQGHVVDFDWRSTRLHLLQNNVVIVPNNRLAQAIVTNYNLPEAEMSVIVQAGVDYASDLAHVERVTLDVARTVLREVEGGVPTFEPVVRFHTYAESSVNFLVVLRGQKFIDQGLLRHELLKRLHVRYAEEGINIPFPVRTLTARQPLPVTVVSSLSKE
ncbi:MAG TPA: mechanosensitive ion channel family protein [Vicinamibacterales bacterium]|nr:mechanosensitive ion channel family protein [Vicinamibacterales bacterium]